MERLLLLYCRINNRPDFVPFKVLLLHILLLMIEHFSRRSCCRCVVIICCSVVCCSYFFFVGMGALHFEIVNCTFHDSKNIGKKKTFPASFLLIMFVFVLCAFHLVIIVPSRNPLDHFTDLRKHLVRIVHQIQCEFASNRENIVKIQVSNYTS